MRTFKFFNFCDRYSPYTEISKLKAPCRDVTEYTFTSTAGKHEPIPWLSAPFGGRTPEDTQNDQLVGKVTRVHMRAHAQLSFRKLYLSYREQYFEAVYIASKRLFEDLNPGRTIHWAPRALYNLKICQVLPMIARIIHSRNVHGVDIWLVWLRYHQQKI